MNQILHTRVTLTTFNNGDVSWFTWSFYLQINSLQSEHFLSKFALITLKSTLFFGEYVTWEVWAKLRPFSWCRIFCCVENCGCLSNKAFALILAFQNGSRYSWPVLLYLHSVIWTDFELNYFSKSEQSSKNDLNFHNKSAGEKQSSSQ